MCEADKPDKLTVIMDKFSKVAVRIGVIYVTALFLNLAWRY